MKLNWMTGKTRRGAVPLWLELLAAAAIVGVLAAASVAGAFSVIRSSRLARLERDAASIFCEASRNLTAACAGGRAEALRDADAAVSDLSGFFADGGWDVPEGSTVYCVSDAAETPAGDALLADVDPALREERFCVFYAVSDAEDRASVLEVWYATRALAAGLPAGLSFEAVADPSDDGARALLREQSGRAAGRIGRCAAEAVSVSEPRLPQAAAERPGLFQCWVEIANAEELTATLYAYVPREGGFYDGGGVTALSYTLELLGVSSGATQSFRSEAITFDAGAGLDVGDGRVYTLGVITLDSLRARSGFRTLFAPAGFVPGEDVMLTLSAACAVNGAAADPVPAGGEGEGAAVARTNSLFASASETASHEAVEIAYGRHLQNLDSALSGVDYGALPIRAAQVQDIYFQGVYGTGTYPGGAGLLAGAEDERYDKPAEQWARTYESRTFLPIENAMLRAYDGGGYLIDGLTVVFADLTGAANAAMDTHSAAEAGLFGLFSGGELTSVTLVDPVLRNDGGIYARTRYAGGLAGRTEGAVAVTDCALRMRARLGADTGGAGRVYADEADWLTASESAGGLIGWAAGPLTITGSYAATVVKSGGYSGGLAGYVSGPLEVRGSYADCYLAGRHVGGLVGQYAGTAGFSACYSAGAVLGQAAHAGRFVGRDVRAAIDDTCYSVFSLTDLLGGGAAEEAYTNETPGPARSDGAAAGGGYYLAPQFDAGSVDESAKLLRYPYPTLGLPHYGDWLPPAAEAPVVEAPEGDELPAGGDARIGFIFDEEGTFS